MNPLCGFLVFLTCGSNLTPPSALLPSNNSQEINNPIQLQPWFVNLNPIPKLCDFCRRCDQADSQASKATTEASRRNDSILATTPSTTDRPTSNNDKPVPEPEYGSSGATNSPAIDSDGVQNDQPGSEATITTNQSSNHNYSSVSSSSSRTDRVETTNKSSTHDVTINFEAPVEKRNSTQGLRKDNSSHGPVIDSFRTTTASSIDEASESVVVSSRNAIEDLLTPNSTPVVDEASTEFPDNAVVRHEPEYELESADAPVRPVDYDDDEWTNDQPRSTQSPDDDHATFYPAPVLDDEITMTQPSIDILTTSSPASDDSRDNTQLSSNDLAASGPTPTTVVTRAGTESPTTMITTQSPRDDHFSLGPIIEALRTTTNRVLTSTSTTSGSATEASTATTQSPMNGPTPARESTLSPLEIKMLRKIKNDFSQVGLNYSAIILRDNSENAVTSPINIARPLAMASYGTHACTKIKLDRLLNLKPNTIELRAKPIRYLVDTLNNFSQDGLIMDNKLWVSDEVTVNPRFAEIMRDNFKSEPQNINFEDTDEAALRINNWSANRTENGVRELAKRDELSQAFSLLFASVAHFNPRWLHRFSREFTSQKPFYVDEDTVKNVTTMLQINRFHHGSLPKFNSTFVELPLLSADSKDPTKVIIILPNKNESLNKIVGNLYRFEYNDLYRNGTTKSVVELSLPRFKVQSEINLNDYRQKLGLCEMFTDDADFSGISESQPLIGTSFIQKTVINVNEGRCRLTNSTCGQEETSSSESSVVFKVNRPFIVLIISGKIILASAKVIDPSV